MFSRSTKTSEETNIIKNKSSSQNRLISNVVLRMQRPKCNFDIREVFYRGTEKQNSNIQGTKYIRVDNKGCIYMVPKSYSG